MSTPSAPVVHKEEIHTSTLSPHVGTGPVCSVSAGICCTSLDPLRCPTPKFERRGLTLQRARLGHHSHYLFGDPLVFAEHRLEVFASSEHSFPD